MRVSKNGISLHRNVHSGVKTHTNIQMGHPQWRGCPFYMVKIKLRGTLLVFLKSLEFQNGMALYINNIDVCVVSFMRLALAVSTKPLFEPIRVS